jgi:hypothetical protein
MSAAAPQTKVRGNKEHLNPAQRFGEVIALAILALIIGYFWRLWQLQTGFFTAAFGPPEQFWFFGPMILSLAAPVVRILVGRRNPGRPFEITTGLLMLVGAIWLLRVFPFDFSHVGDALPGNLPRFFTWVPDWFGKLILVLQLVGGAIGAITTTWQFIGHSMHE